VALREATKQTQQFDPSLGTEGQKGDSPIERNKPLLQKKLELKRRRMRKKRAGDDGGGTAAGDFSRGKVAKSMGT